VQDSLYDRVKLVFVEAGARTGAEREDFLTRACGEDRVLRARVERLLEVHDGGGGILVDAAAMVAGEGVTRVPERIGEYEVESVLGVGGMGVVYRARQASPRRAVAVKVLSPGFVTREALGRFRREAEVLGRLTHPGIVQIYESGTWESELGEQPFLVMELVDGTTLTDYCAAHALDTFARLRLLVRICRAVHHAHEMGVVHRDLKPGNILVTGQGDPKILDFGVAKLSEEVAGAATLRTGVGHLLGTIAYMSPEQVEGSAVGLDRRSDVYSLGVITYELVSGVLPHDLSAVPLTAAARIIKETDPRPLGSFDRSLRGDLQTIVAKALEKDAARRYASTAELADDLERFLRNEPIAARPPTTVYVLRKLARRNRGLFVGLAVAMAVLLAATAISVTLAVEASRQRDLAQGEVQQLLAVEEIQQAMLFATDPQLYMSYLENAAASVATAYADRPAAEGAARKLLARYFWRAGRIAEWRAQLDAAAALESRLGPGHPIVLRALLDEGEGLATMRRHGEAEALLRSACKHCEETFGPSSAETLRCRAAWIHSLFELRRWEEAESLARDAAERARAALPVDDPARISIDRTLARLALNRGQQSQAIDPLAESVKAIEGKYSDQHAQWYAAESRLAVGLRESGRFDEAIEIGRRDVEFSRQRRGADHPETARAELGLGNTFFRADRHDEALPLLEHCIRIFTETQGSEVPETMLGRSLLAGALLGKGELARAESIAAALVATFEEVHEPDRMMAADAVDLLGCVRLAQGRHAEAEPLFAAAIEAARAWDAGHPQSVKFRRDHARCLRELGRFEEAEASLLPMHGIAMRQLGEKSRHTRSVAAELDALYTAWGRADQAEIWRQRTQ